MANPTVTEAQERAQQIVRSQGGLYAQDQFVPAEPMPLKGKPALKDKP